MTRFSDREQRLIALALLMLALAAFWLTIALPLLDGGQTRRQRREAAQQTLDHGRRVLSEAGSMHASNALLRAHAPEAFVAAPTADAARTSIQAHVVAAVAANDVVLESLRPLPSPAPLLRYELHVHGDASKTLALLRQLEVAAPIARVSEVDLTHAVTPADGGEVRPLGMRLVLSYAFMASP